ncbi:MAG: GTPase domain-containing protein [Chloroflexia bacterium]|nr:GTPase domain-containing protein [Chloroflexia bacterium]
MLCPFCLAEDRFKRERTRTSLSYSCPNCNEPLPALYVQQYRQYPPVVISAVGFRQHGKTVYFAALFYALKKLGLPQYWSTFFTMALNEDSLATVYDNVGLLESGELPLSTPKNFPRPTMLRLEDIPFFRHVDYTLLCYDTGGESFERPTQLVQYAGFVRRARSVMFLISLSDLQDPAEEMHRLLNTYVVGMGELGGAARDQHLVVVYTKGDRLPLRLPQWGERWPDLGEYLRDGSMESLARPRGYLRRMHRVSERLREFTQEELGAYEFLNMTGQSFRSVAFSMVSSLGAEPEEGRMPVQIAPRRVLDPLLWTIERSQPRWWG